jgi:hypothetical protein
LLGGDFEELRTLEEVEAQLGNKDLAVQEICARARGGAKFWGDVEGGGLDPAQAKAAREEEMQFVRKTPVREKVSRSVPRRKRVEIIRARWVDTNKGAEEAPNVRYRMVAMEFKASTSHVGNFELFSAMPPLEAMRMIASHAATCDNA